MITPINLGDSSWGSYSLKLRISTNDLQISPLELMKFARWFHSGPPAHPHGPTHRTDGSAACLGTHSEWPPQKPLMPLGSLEGPSILPCLPSWPLFENSEFNQSKRGDCQVHHLIFRSRNCKSSPSTSGIRWKNPLTTPNFCAWLALHLDQPVPAPAYRCFRENMRNRAISGLVFVPYVIYCNVM